MHVRRSFSLAFTIEVCGLVSNSLTMAWNWKVWRSQPKIFGTKKLVGPKRGLGLHNWVCRGLCRFVVYFKTPSQRRETAKFCLHNQKSLAQKNCISAHERLSLTKRKDFGRKTTSRCWAKTSLQWWPDWTGTNDGEQSKGWNIRSQLNSTNWWQNLVSGNFSTLKKKKKKKKPKPKPGRDRQLFVRGKSDKKKTGTLFALHK